MYNFKIKIASKIINISTNYKKTLLLCKNYITYDKEDFCISISNNDILYEKEKTFKEENYENLPHVNYSNSYLETLAVYRKIVEKLIDYNIILFHGSSISLNNIGYIFTGKSGVGKSTHAQIWKKVFRDTIIINDDKPLIEISNDMKIYGTPWSGKDSINTNTSVILKNICNIKQSKKNIIKKLDSNSSYQLLLQQSYRCSNKEYMNKLIKLIDILINKINIYELSCNKDEESAIIAYNYMK